MANTLTHSRRRALATPGWTLGVLACALCAVAGASARAALGADRASVQADGRAWLASSAATPANGAQLHTQNLPEGLTVRQYLDAGGTVFAVAWEGPVLPDLARLLGPYYPRYAQAIRQQRRGALLADADLVIESGGMMRAYSGRAWLPAKLPTAWTARDIR